MIALIQRVKQARVDVNGEMVGQIGQGILAFIGVEKDDNKQQADALLRKIISYRIFNDFNGKMNLSLQDIGGELLLVSQFTLVANTQKGLRPSFSSGASPAEGERLFNYLCQQAKKTELTIATGQFAADMQVSLVNDGPVTFWLQS
ncbi:D-aminoacyl-tRNA deacylase [Marinicella gelatinilytica]|uniref:D-aminoacyl-tRNA deacylase n=1 Tax=Marinicella gelatinilytica TaxID=2996017 RepID=UPI0022608D39|nr:D-aminoacyl-tRNA deacylase [Marinicella gelatinilytica]MCX7544123.1 D-aminoacyl-tRNA deacylase [Marinicella gelatinilytica]